jgi:hypothetical protein
LAPLGSFTGAITLHANTGGSTPTDLYQGNLSARSVTVITL